MKENKRGYGLEKQAVNMADFVPSLGDLGSAATEIGAMAATYLVASSLVAGIGGGWLAAKATAKGRRDMKTVREGYENERLGADLDYLDKVTESERKRIAAQKAPKAARVMG